MGDLNVVTVLGRLTRDVELKQTNGWSVARFSLANGYRKKQGNEYVEATNFIDCVAFGKTGEAIQKYVSKGQRLLVSGALRWSSWEIADGKKQSKLEVLVESFNFIERKESGPQSGPTPADISGLDDIF
jgi:single-strand DNA-binding protein